MGYLKALVFIVTTLLIINLTASVGFGSCPPKNKVTNSKPTCHSDADCQKYGKLCCPNQFNTKSCVDRSPWSNGVDDSKSKYTGGAGGGTLCDGVKCRPYEVCKLDTFTKRFKCMQR